jgi:DNA-binding IclR family transcriptional regulator
MGETASLGRVEGSQSIDRAAELLSHVAARADTGARLAELVEVSRLTTATARRILQALVHNGLLTFDRNSKIYKVGPAIYSHAVKGNSLYSQRELFMPALANIARRTDDTVMFSLRIGLEAVCLVRREGAFPIRVMTLAEGSRRPLGAGSGSLAILAFLGEEERARVLQQCSPLYARFGLSEAVVAKGVTDARRTGFVFNPGLIVEGVYGVGIPILHKDRAVASVSVTAIANRMTTRRRLEIVEIVREELAPLSDFKVPLGFANSNTGVA